MQARLSLSAAVVLLALLPSPRVMACGATPHQAVALLPEPGAEDVPLNAVLLLSDNFGETTLFLRKSDEPEVDLEVETRCFVAKGSGAVCQGWAALEANTEYRWAAAPAQGFGAGSGGAPEWDSEDWSRFTTGEEEAEFPAEGAAEVELLSHDEFEQPHPCGLESTTLFELGSGKLDQPVVVNLQGVTPGYVVDAQRLLPGDDSMEWALYNLPRCSVIELYGSTGQRWTQEEAVCLPLPEAPVPIPLGDAGAPQDAGTAEEPEKPPSKTLAEPRLRGAAEEDEPDTSGCAALPSVDLAARRSGWLGGALALLLGLVVARRRC